MQSTGSQSDTTGELRQTPGDREGQGGLARCSPRGHSQTRLVNLGKLREIGRDKEAWRGAVHGVTVRHDWAAEQQP